MHKEKRTETMHSSFRDDKIVKRDRGIKMKCKKCGSELPDLAMYCTECGAPQFERPETELPTLELADPMNRKVIIDRVDNMTAALSALRKITGMEMKDLRRALDELPFTAASMLSEEKAEQLAAQLREAGIEARVSKGNDEEIVLRGREE
jgi:ribosomal protein L7/L12